MQTNTLSPAEVLPAASQDQADVAAVRQGDTERYRELVERHGRQVYAVAWSRLGDAALAEEAAQEAFIRGYRYLGMLGDGAKFSAWIGAIVRNAAIRLGMRQRRELDKRTRWALEQPVATEAALEAEDPAMTETLRRVLAELPAAHRDCLVLFYLEGKSGAEAAAALGISESAFRVRLHRARGVLREQMEEQLGESLGRLRPPATLVPSVMGVVMSSTSAKLGGGAGFGATFGTVLAKVLPFKLAAAFLPVAGMAPVFGFSWWMNREERRNYRDADGFRAKLHRKTFSGAILYYVAFILVMLFVMPWVTHRLGAQTIFLVLGAWSLVIQALSLRMLVLNRSRYQIAGFSYTLIMALAMLATGAGWLTIQVFCGVVFLASLIVFFMSRARPMRMDYSLFLRASQGMLPNTKAHGAASSHALSLERSQLLAFARFLGVRYLAENYRWTDEGLMLCLPSVSGGIFTGLAKSAYLLLSKCSWLLLKWNGQVHAHCLRKEEEALAALGGPALFVGTELEPQVASAVEHSWGAFRAGELAAADCAIGQAPETEVFVVPTMQSRAARWRKGMLLVYIVIVVASLAFGLWSNEHLRQTAAKHAPASTASAPRH